MLKFNLGDNVEIIKDSPLMGEQGCVIGSHGGGMFKGTMWPKTYTIDVNGEKLTFVEKDLKRTEND